MGLRPNESPARVALLLFWTMTAGAYAFAGPAAAQPGAAPEGLRPQAPARDLRLNTLPAYLGPLPRARPGAAVRVEAESISDIGTESGEPDLPRQFAEIARRSGEPQIPGLQIIYLHPLGDPAAANDWRNIIVHQTEGPAGSARSLAIAQSKNPSKRGVTVWVETDGTVYWSTAENAIPTHGDGANRNDNKYIDNSRTYRAVIRTNSLGVEFVGNFPDVAKPASTQQVRSWLILVRFLQERYQIAPENIYAHNWIDFKDRRYYEGCDLATLARKLSYRPGRSLSEGARNP